MSLFDASFDVKPGKRTREEKAERAAERAKRKAASTPPDVIVDVVGRWRVIAGRGCHWIATSSNGQGTAKCGTVGTLLTAVEGDRAVACRACIEKGARP